MRGFRRADRPRRIVEAVTEGWLAADTAPYGNGTPIEDLPRPEMVHWTLRFDEALPLEVSLGLDGSADRWTFDRAMLGAALATSAEDETYYGDGDVRIGRVKSGIAFELRGHGAPPVLGVIPLKPAEWFVERMRVIAPPEDVRLDVDALIAQLQGES